MEYPKDSNKKGTKRTFLSINNLLIIRHCKKESFIDFFKLMRKLEKLKKNVVKTLALKELKSI